MATFAISDVHGCYDELQELLDKIGFGSADELWVLGDLVDRGPDSTAVLKWAIDAPQNHHFLLGNHDDMMASVLWQQANGRHISLRETPWYWNGGLETEAKFGNEPGAWVFDVVLPWLDELPLHAKVSAGGEEFMLVHAGFDPSKWSERGLGWPDMCLEEHCRSGLVDVGYGFGEQHAQDMLWCRDGWLDSPVPAPLPTIHGHTPVNALSVVFYDLLREHGMSFSGGEDGAMLRVWNRYDIDCGCAYGGSLCALRLDDMTPFYVKSKAVD